MVSLFLLAMKGRHHNFIKRSPFHPIMSSVQLASTYNNIYDTLAKLIMFVQLIQHNHKEIKVKPMKLIMILKQIPSMIDFPFKSYRDKCLISLVVKRETSFPIWIFVYYVSVTFGQQKYLRHGQHNRHTPSICELHPLTNLSIQTNETIYPLSIILIVFLLFLSLLSINLHPLNINQSFFYTHAGFVYFDVKMFVFQYYVY